MTGIPAAARPVAVCPLKNTTVKIMYAKIALASDLDAAWSWNDLRARSTSVLAVTIAVFVRVLSGTFACPLPFEFRAESFILLGAERTRLILIGIRGWNGAFLIGIGKRIHVESMKHELLSRQFLVRTARVDIGRRAND
jgi:hypothetical protein